MALSITHAAVVATADDGTSEVGSNEWNAAHTVAFTSGSLTGTGETVTASSPVLNLSQTWNNAAVAFTGVKLNVTNTASLTGSKVIDLQVGGSSVFLADSGGKVVIGGGTALSVFPGSTQPSLQVLGVDAHTSVLAAARFTNTATATARIQISKSRGGSIGTYTTVVDTDRLGELHFGGSEGTQFVAAAIIRSDVDGTPAAGAVPGALLFQTSNTSGTIVERMRIGSSGAVTITETVGASALTLTGATQTVSNPALNITQTWNAGAVTFTALKLNVTNTASASASLLLDLQVGASTKASVDVSGNLTATTINSGIGIGATDVLLFRDAAGLLAQRNSTNAQQWRLYNTYTNSSNGEWLEANWAGNAMYLRTQANGTGSGRAMNLACGDVLSLEATSSYVQIKTSGGGVYQITSADIIPGSADNTLNLGRAANRFQYLYLGTTTVASLPAAAANIQGARTMVTNANSNTFLASVVAATSTSTAQIVPVFCDGAAWKIG